MGPNNWTLNSCKLLKGFYFKKKKNLITLKYKFNFFKILIFIIIKIKMQTFFSCYSFFYILYKGSQYKEVRSFVIIEMKKSFSSYIARHKIYYWPCLTSGNKNIFKI